MVPGELFYWCWAAGNGVTFASPSPLQTQRWPSQVCRSKTAPTRQTPLPSTKPAFLGMLSICHTATDRCLPPCSQPSWSTQLACTEATSCQAPSPLWTTACITPQTWRPTTVWSATRCVSNENLRDREGLEWFSLHVSVFPWVTPKCNACGSEWVPTCSPD